MIPRISIAQVILILVVSDILGTSLQVVRRSYIFSGIFNLVSASNCHCIFKNINIQLRS